MATNEDVALFRHTLRGVLFYAKEANMDERTRRQRLYQLAQQDEIYQGWESGFRECADQFYEFASTCPENVRSFLYGYADYGRMMMQRMVNLACRNMEFPDHTQ